MLTEPERWSAAAVYQATRIFTSALKEKMAQRFLNQVRTWAFLVKLECPKRFMHTELENDTVACSFITERFTRHVSLPFY